MHSNRARPLFALGALAAGPVLLGAGGPACSPTGPPGLDAGDAAPPLPCVSLAGGPCGGNAVPPCTCSPGLTCTPGDGGLPFGDVGGICDFPVPPADAETADAPADAAVP